MPMSKSIAGQGHVNMTDPDPHTNVLLIQATEQHLNKIRMRLEDVFAFLKIAHDASVVCMAACKQTSTDCDEEIASVMFHIVNYRIDSQMRVISLIVEELGGRTDYTEEHERARDLIDKVNRQGKYANTESSHEQK